MKISVNLIVIAGAACAVIAALTIYLRKQNPGAVPRSEVPAVASTTAEDEAKRKAERKAKVEAMQRRLAEENPDYEIGPMKNIPGQIPGAKAKDEKPNPANP